MAKPPSEGRKAPDTGIDSSFALCEMALKRYLARFLHRREDIEDMAQET